MLPNAGDATHSKGGRSVLGGVRVVELTHHLVGPLAAQYLADFGADVVKVESLAGDPRRTLGPTSPAGFSQQFLAVNRNKRSLSLDLRAADGRAIMDRLLATADVFVTNYTTEALRGLALDPATVRARHPSLVVASLTAFGATGPSAHRKAFDLNVSGETGLLLEDASGTPHSNAAPFADTGGAIMFAFGVVLALLDRARGGSAQSVETSLASINVALMAHRFVWLDGAPVPNLTPALGPNPLAAIYAPYPTADGFVTIAAPTLVLWRRLCHCLELDALAGDPSLGTFEDVLAQQARLRPILAERIRGQTTDAWMTRLLEAGIPAGRILRDEAVFAHPALEALGMVQTLEHPHAGRYRTMGFPIALDGAPASIRRHTPSLGEDTRAILGELAYDGAAIERLRATGVIGIGPDVPRE